MQCWECDQPAHAPASSAGASSAKNTPRPCQLSCAMFLGGNNTPKGLAVANVIWCGICEPQPEPIGMPEMF